MLCEVLPPFMEHVFHVIPCKKDHETCVLTKFQSKKMPTQFLSLKLNIFHRRTDKGLEVG